MIVLRTTTAAQTIKVIPRRYDAEFTMSIRDDSTNVVVNYDITTAILSGNYYTFTNVFSPILVEGHFYDLDLSASFDFWNTNYSLWENYNVKWNADSGLYKDRIFCTDQNIQLFQYKLNENQYIQSESGSNDYIVL
tara:strand:+ start:601 stop:1008 length:408 start_codon:yes stop_codon:yes gene_type:complete